MKIYRCAKCKRQIDCFIEFWSGQSIEYSLNKETGSFRNQGGCDDSDPTSVKAVCKCGHEWTLKGVRQIYELGEIEHLSHE